MRSLAVGALTGGAVIGAVYAAARRRGLTAVDLAERLAPDQPLKGRIAQLAIGSAACLPSAATRRPIPGAALGAAVGIVAAARRPSGDRTISAAAHAAGGAAAALVTARRRACP
jgi:hypothetical protein